MGRIRPFKLYMDTMDYSYCDTNIAGSKVYLGPVR